MTQPVAAETHPDLVTSPTLLTGSFTAGWSYGDSPHWSYGETDGWTYDGDAGFTYGG